MAENWEQKIASLPEPARSEALRIAENVQGLMAFLSQPVAERISTIERLQRKAQQASGALTIGITSGTELEKHIKGVWGKTNDFTSVPAQVIYDTLVAANGIWNKESGAKWISKEEAMEVAFHAGQILEKEHAKQADSWGIGSWRAWFSAVASYVTDYVKDLINGTRETKNFSDYYEAAKTQLVSKTKLEDTREISVALREKLQGARYGDGKVVDSQLAQYIAGVDHQDDFVPTAASRLPAFVDPNDKTLAAGITEEQRKKNPTLADTAAKGFSGIESKEDVMHTATGVVAATAVAGGAVYAAKKVGGTAAKVVTAPLRWGANGTMALGRGIGLLPPAAAPVHPMAAAMSQPAAVATEAGAARASAGLAARQLAWTAGAGLLRFAANPYVGATVLVYSLIPNELNPFYTGNIPNDQQEALMASLGEFTSLMPKTEEAAKLIEDESLRALVISSIRLEKLHQEKQDQQVKLAERNAREKVTWRFFATEESKRIGELEEQIKLLKGAVDTDLLANLQANGLVTASGKLVVGEKLESAKAVFAQAQQAYDASLAQPKSPANDKVSSAAPIPADALLAAREGVIAQARAAASKENKVALVSETPTPFARVSEVKLMGVLPADTLPASGNPLPTGVSAKADVATAVAAG